MNRTEEGKMKHFSERMAALRETFQKIKERKYIERRLKANGIDINELEEA